VRTDEQPEPAGGRLSLWAGVIGAPLVWAADLQVRYALVPVACGSRSQLVLHVLSVVFILSALACAALCLHEWRASGIHVPDSAEGGTAARTQFLSAVGLMSSVLFLVIITAQALPGFFMGPCIE